MESQRKNTSLMVQERMRMERDTDLLKLQILADYYHSNYVGYLSFVFGLIIAWTVALMTLTLENFLNIPAYLVSLLMGFTVLGSFLYVVLRTYHNNLDGIDKLIQNMNKNRLEPLPSIRELRKRKSRGEPK